MTSAELAQGRHFLASVGLTPHALARRDRPAVLVDVVDGGATFTELFGLVRDWIDEERQPWPVIRRKLRWSPVVAAGPGATPSLVPWAAIPRSRSRGYALSPQTSPKAEQQFPVHRSLG